MDYNSIPFRNKDIDRMSKDKNDSTINFERKVKEGPRRTVKKYIHTFEDNAPLKLKNVENVRGSKRVSSIGSQRASVTKTYGRNAKEGTGLENESKVTKGQVRRWSKDFKK